MGLSSLPVLLLIHAATDAAKVRFMDRGPPLVLFLADQAVHLAVLEDEDRGDSGQDGVPGSGRLIGILERALTLVLVLLGQWGAIGLLVTAKSVARFEALKHRHFAEYYLVGTLTSLLVAIVSGIALAAVLEALSLLL